MADSNQHSVPDIAEKVLLWQRLSDSNSNPYSAQSALGEACGVIGGLIEQQEVYEENLKAYQRTILDLKEQYQSALALLSECAEYLPDGPSTPIAADLVIRIAKVVSPTTETGAAPEDASGGTRVSDSSGVPSPAKERL